MPEVQLQQSTSVAEDLPRLFLRNLLLTFGLPYRDISARKAAATLVILTTALTTCRHATYVVVAFNFRSGILATVAILCTASANQQATLGRSPKPGVANHGRCIPIAKGNGRGSQSEVCGRADGLRLGNCQCIAGCPRLIAHAIGQWRRRRWRFTAPVGPL